MFWRGSIFCVRIACSGGLEHCGGATHTMTNGRIRAAPNRPLSKNSQRCVWCSFMTGWPAAGLSMDHSAALLHKRHSTRDCEMSWPFVSWAMVPHHHGPELGRLCLRASSVITIEVILCKYSRRISVPPQCATYRWALRWLMFTTCERC